MRQVGVGVVYAQNTSAFSFANFVSGGSQTRVSLTTTAPRVVFGLGQVIPSGQSGWMTFSIGGAVGASLNYNPLAASSPTANNGGRNLSAAPAPGTSPITITSLRIPIFPTAGCD